MGVMIASVHPVRVHGAEILNLKPDKRLGKIGLVAKLDGELVYKEID